MFTNKDFQVDFESEEYKLLHPVISKQDKVRRQASTTQEGEASDSGSDDDHELWEKVKIDRRAERLAKREKEENVHHEGGCERANKWWESESR